MKNKNLKLNELEVKSFVSAIETNDKQTVKGGYPLSVNFCDTDFVYCRGSYIC